MMKVLVIADYTPYPLVSGDRIRLYNLIKRVARHHEVSLAAFLYSPHEAEGLAHLRQFCHRVETVSLERRHPLAHIPGLVHFALAGKPPELKFLYSEDLVDKIRWLVSVEDFDLVQIEKERMAPYLEVLPPSLQARSLLMLYDIAYKQYWRISRIERRFDQKVRAILHSCLLRCWEPHYLERFAYCSVVSQADRRLLLATSPRLRVDVMPNGVDSREYQILPATFSPVLLFIGSMSYSPSADAAVYLCREIFPRLRRLVANATLWIVGKDPPPEVIRLAGECVHVTGRVDDIVPYYQQSTVCVVPLRAGGGTRLKILEAMAFGRPVVSTTIGCEGLDVADGEHLLIADSPDEFAAKAARLLTDKALWHRITTNARQLVETRYDWDIVAARLMRVYAEMMVPRRTKAPSFAIGGTRGGYHGHG